MGDGESTVTRGREVTVNTCGDDEGPSCVATLTLVVPVAPWGTTTRSSNADAVVVTDWTGATIPLNLTTFCPVKASKLVPMIVTVAPAGPLMGAKLLIFGLMTKL